MSLDDERDDNAYEPESTGKSGALPHRDADDGRPEPPVRWNPDQAHDAMAEIHQEPPSPQSTVSGMLGPANVELRGNEALEFQSARRLVTASQVIALVSLFLGGAVASCIAIVCALVARGKLNRIAQAHDDNPAMQSALRRTSTMAIGVACVALAINIVTVILLYPYVMDMVQSGDFGIFGNASQSTGSGSVTWG